MKKNKKENLEQELNKKDGPLIYDDHPIPKTRRDFLASGIIGLSTSLLLPNLTTLLGRSNAAFAQSIGECALPEFRAGLPYLCFEGAGGMNIPGNNAMVGFVSGGEHQGDFAPNGYTDADFIRMGLNPSLHPNRPGMINEDYGLMFHSQSGILEGLNDALEGVMVQDTDGNMRPIQEMIDGLILCNRTGDDSANNTTNTVYMANKAGAQGELVQLIGDSNTDSGARSQVPADQLDLSRKPSRIRSFDDSAGLLSLGDKLMSRSFLDSTAAGGDVRVKQFMDKVSQMSRSKLEDFKQLNAIDQIKAALDCSYQTATQLFEKFSAEALNPMNDAAKTMQINNAFGTTDLGVASVANLVLDSVAGAGSVTVGGCDYHNGTATSGHRKDREVGRKIGKCIALAAQKGKNLFCHLYTDGGVVGDNGGLEDDPNMNPDAIPGKVVWTSDSGTRSSALLIVYKHGHTGGSLVREDANGPRRQIGNFVRAGGVELDASPISNSQENLWKAIMLNYLAAQGREGEFEDIFGRGSLPPDYESMIRFKKIV